MRTLRKGAAVLAACLLACQCIQQQASPASAYVITSQYLGAAPSRGDEHLLLFKIPEPISSQLLESRQQSFHPLHLQQQQHLNARESRLLVQANQEPVMVAQPAFYPPQVVSHVPVQSTPRLRYEPASSAVVQEQAVSLTIPISTLQTVETQQHHQPTPPLTFINGAQLYQEPQQQQQQQQPIASKQVALELSVADYLSLADQPDPTPDDNQQQQQQQQQQQSQLTANQLGGVVSVDRALRNAADQNLFMVQSRSNMVASRQPVTLSLTSVNREPQLNQRANYSLQQSYLAGLNPLRLQNDRLAADAQETAQPSLWRESQPPLHYATSPSAAHQQVNANQSEIAGLVAKLSSSSPDLLIRLKNLLKRAASAPHHNAFASVGPSANGLGDAYGVANHTSSGAGLRILDRSLKHFQNDADGNSELLVANNVSTSELKNMVQEYVNSQEQLGGRGSLSANSFGQHSLGTLLSSQNVSSSHEEIKIPLIVIAMPRILSLKRNQMASAGLSAPKSPNNASRLPTITAELAQRLIRQHLPQILATNLSSSASPFSEPGSGQLALVQQPAQQSNYSDHVNTTQTYWLGQQHVTATTSLPLHTMAPYAQQFVMPGVGSAPLIRNEFAPLHQQQTFFYPSNQSEYLLSNANGQATSSQFRPIAESTLISRQNSTSPGRLGPLLDNSGNNVQIQLLDSQQGAGLDHHHKSGGHIRLVARSQQPLYEFRQEADPVSEYVQSNNQQQQQQQQQQQYVYLNTAPQRRANRLLANYTDEHARPVFNDLQEQAEHSAPLTPMKSRVSLFEEQIGRLRPLFQAPIKREYATNHLSPSQMLALLSRSKERRMSSGDRLQQSVDGADLGLGTRSGASAAQKQSPKMLLMVV